MPKEMSVKVRVRFVKHRGEVLAIIRDVWDPDKGKWVKSVQTSRCHGYKVVTCYVHVGQHSEVAWDWAKSLRPASPEEFRPLLKELVEIVGYDVCKVLNRNH